MSKYPGTLIVVSGSTGSGKGTLIKYLLSKHPHLVYPRTCTTRAHREGEPDDAYYFLSQEEFEQKIQNGALLEWARYGGHYYGTPKSEVVPALEAGKTVLLEIEIQGARTIRAELPAENLVTVFIDVGSWEQLERRVRARAPISDEELVKRKERYQDESAYRDSEARYVINNADGRLEEAKVQFEQIITDIIANTSTTV